MSEYRIKTIDDSHFESQISAVAQPNNISLTAGSDAEFMSAVGGTPRHYDVMIDLHIKHLKMPIIEIVNASVNEE